MLLCWRLELSCWGLVINCRAPALPLLQLDLVRMGERVEEEKDRLLERVSEVFVW